jgi:ATP-binding cassette subfamily B protein
MGVFPLPALPTWGLLASVLMSSACLVVIGRAMKTWIDGAADLGGGVPAGAIPAFVVLALALASSSGMRVYTATVIGEQVGARLRLALFSSITSRPLSYFERTPAGGLLSLILSDVTVIQMLLRQKLSPLARNVLVLIGASLMMAVTSSRLTVLCLLALPAPAAAVLLLSRQRRKLVREVYDQIGLLASQVEEVISGIHTIKTLNRESIEHERFSESVLLTNELARRLAARRSALLALMLFLGLAGVGLILQSGLSSLGRGAMTSGTLSSFLFFLLLAGGSCVTLSDLWSDTIDGAAALLRIIRHFDDGLAASPSALRSTPEHRPPAAVRLEGVGFRYPSRSEDLALEAVSFEVAPGETVAIVGASGAGKSTIARLLLGFDRPQSGRILIDGTDTARLDPAQIRDCFAVVPQDPFIFSASIAQNIRYGRPDATDCEVRSAAERAAVHLFAQDLPFGLETFVGERGTRLSGGQRQRIAIARAILRGAPILLLDEATSALDSVTERLVHDAILSPPHPATTLVIAHRLSTLRLADRIIVMHRGRVEATGLHDELMSRSALYRRLTELQLGGEP